MESIKAPRLWSSLGFAGGKHYQKINTPIFKLVLQKFAIPGCFPYIIFYRYLFSLLFLVGLLLQSVALFQSRELVKYLELFLMWFRVAISNDKST